MSHSLQVCPGWSLNFPLSQAEHVVAPGVLDLPTVHFVQDALGGSLPIVPAGHAVNPLPVESDESILDPFGTTTDADPPSATMRPSGTRSQPGCSGSGCKYPDGHFLHSTLPPMLENLPGEQGMQETEPVLLVYVPFRQGFCVAFAPSHV